MRNPILIYSARHTGTWFVNSLLCSSNLKIVTYPDIWLSELTGIQFIEQLPATTLNQSWINDFFSSYVPSFRTEGSDMLILQGHHFDTSAPLYQALVDTMPELDVVIPMRNPLLAINSRVWRVAGTIDNLRRLGKENRTKRAARVFQYFLDLLTIPKEYVFTFPIDTPRLKEEAFRIEQVKRILEFCSLQITDQVIQKAQEWGTVNNTKNGKYHEKYQRRVPTDDFLFSTVKDAILHNDQEAVKEVLDIEFEYLQSHAELLQPRLEALGYTDLLWW